ASGCGAGRFSTTGCGAAAGGCGTGTGRFSTTGGGATVCVATCCGGGAAAGRAVVVAGVLCVRASCSRRVFSAAMRFATSSLTLDVSIAGAVDVVAVVPRTGAVDVAAIDVAVVCVCTMAGFAATAFGAGLRIAKYAMAMATTTIAAIAIGTTG